jgi:two-component system CheB/CheR fusion protein
MSYRPIEIRSPMNQLISDHHPVLITDVGITTGNSPQPGSGTRRWFDVHLLPLIGKDRNLAGVKVVFQDVTRAHELSEALQQSSSDLETAYEEVQSSNEELETTNEELQSTVEELETTNEELQSTNEELETMNEELQSTNEELESVNDELRSRGEELNRTSAFFQSVLRSLHVGVVVVDQDLMVTAWNSRAEDLWGVRADEAIGTHFLNLDIGLKLQQFIGPMRESLADQAPGFETVVEATNRRGRRIMCRIGINPLVDAGSASSGAVILMEEVETPAAQEGSA